MDPVLSLQQQIEALASDFPGTPGVAARNLTSGETVEVNDRLSFPTASMIKVPVLLELLRQCAQGEARLSERRELRDGDRTLGSGLLLELDAGASLTLRDLAVLMMSISDNTATNMLIDRVGIDAVNQACRVAGMTETELRNRIDWELIRQSHDNLGVGTPRDFCTLFAALYRGELLPEAETQQMLNIMRVQKYIEPLRKYLPFDPYSAEFGEPVEVWVASKTGGLQGVRGEAGLVHTPRAAWAIAVMTKGFGDRVSAPENVGSAFISRVSRAVYDAWS